MNVSSLPPPVFSNSNANGVSNTLSKSYVPFSTVLNFLEGYEYYENERLGLVESEMVGHGIESEHALVVWIDAPSMLPDMVKDDEDNQLRFIDKITNKILKDDCNKDCVLVFDFSSNLNAGINQEKLFDDFLDGSLGEFFDKLHSEFSLAKIQGFVCDLKPNFEEDRTVRLESFDDLFKPQDNASNNSAESAESKTDYASDQASDAHSFSPDREFYKRI